MAVCNVNGRAGRAHRWSKQLRGRCDTSGKSGRGREDGEARPDLRLVSDTGCLHVCTCACTRVWFVLGTAVSACWSH